MTLGHVEQLEPGFTVSGSSCGSTRQVFTGACSDKQATLSSARRHDIYGMGTMRKNNESDRGTSCLVESSHATARPQCG